MILGIKTRWLNLASVASLSNQVELHLELEDINERLEEQAVFLKKFNKIYHLHVPFRNPRGFYADFVRDFHLFEKTVKLGDLINNGEYHLVVHCPLTNNLDKIITCVNKILEQSSKVILCFENNHGVESRYFREPDEFVRLFKAFDNPRLGMCLDVCHAYLDPKPLFDEFIKKVYHNIKHVHLADVGLNYEHGVQIGEGIINFKYVFSKIPNTILIPEVAGSHLDNSAGLKTAFNRLKKFLKEPADSPIS